MRPARLGLLAVSALLTTSIGLSGTAPERAMAALDSTEAAARTMRPAVSAAPSSRAMSGDEAARALASGVAAQIYTRLSTRHTALPQRERIALAHTIVREARAHDLDPDLVLAVIEVESGGYHLAVSTVGAMGLMQLLPSTGEEVAGKLDIEWHGDDTLFDPTTNVKLGTAYLRELANRYGDVRVALAAYNWGPGRIDRRLRRGASVPSRYIEQVMNAYERGVTLASRRS